MATVWLIRCWILCDASHLAFSRISLSRFVHLRRLLPSDPWRLLCRSDP